MANGDPTPRSSSRGFRRGPTVSVIVNTFNRANRVLDTVDAVLAQEHPSFELIVVDDGSSDGTHEALAAIENDLVTVVSHANRGLGSSRRTGADRAAGDWLVFLDDDDTPLPGWLAGLTRFADDPECAITSCGARYRLPEGSTSPPILPSDLGPVFSNCCALFLAGTFAVRASIYEEAGGYLAGMPCSHQTELSIRLVACSTARGMTARSIATVLIELERRDHWDRPLSSASMLFWGTRWLLARHRTALERSRATVADLEGVAGVAAFQLARTADARQHFARAATYQPRDPRRWTRLLLASLPRLGGRVWGSTTNPDPTMPDGVAADRSEPVLDLVAADIRRRGVNEDGLFLPWGYETNEQQSADSEGTPFWAEGLEANDVGFQDPVYRFAAKVVKARGFAPVMDIGCGSGDKLVRRIGEVTTEFIGVDQPSGVELATARFAGGTWIAADFTDPNLWRQLAGYRPGLVISADVIEHLDHPVEFLDGLRTVIGDGGLGLISTPDRARLAGAAPTGPPANPRHVREWTADEFALLLESVGLEVIETRHFLPRRYDRSVLELKRMAWKVLHLRPLPDRRYNMAFLVRTRKPVSVAAATSEQPGTCQSPAT